MNVGCMDVIFKGGIGIYGVLGLIPVAVLVHRIRERIRNPLIQSGILSRDRRPRKRIRKRKRLRVAVITGGISKTPPSLPAYGLVLFEQPAR